MARQIVIHGRFISFEGGEGAGKSTQANLLARTLRNAGVTVVLTREPGGSPRAEKVRALLLEERWDPLSETLLFGAARRDHLRTTIAPALERGEWVVTDRFADSSLAYQGHGKNEYRATELINRLVVGDRWPDLIFFLDVPPEVGLTRARARGDVNRFETEDLTFHERVRHGFSQIADRHPVGWLLDASKSIEDVHNEVVTRVRQRFGVP